MTIDPKTSTLRIEKFAVQVYDLNRFFAIFCDFLRIFPKKQMVVVTGTSS